MITTSLGYAAVTRAAPAPTAVTATGPTAVEILAAPAPYDDVPAILRRDPSRSLIDRTGVDRTSRAVDRDPLPGCTGVVGDIGTNGRLPLSALCDLWQAPYQDRADAVVAISALNDDFRARFGRDICLTSGYRTLEQQSALRASKGGLAAPPGQSNHGWGLAVDICASDYEGERGTWLHEVGPVYGWANPEWAHRGGGGPYEPWHWEFTQAVAEIDARR